VDGYSGDAGDALTTIGNSAAYVANGKLFCTPDQDVDGRSEANYATYTQVYGGWWIGHYSQSILNRNAGGMWQTSGWDGNPYDVQASRMLVKSP